MWCVGVVGVVGGKVARIDSHDLYMNKLYTCPGVYLHNL